MRRRIDSEPQESKEVKTPPFVQSRSLNFEPNAKTVDMQLISHDALGDQSESAEIQPEIQCAKSKRCSSDNRERCYISSGIKHIQINHGETENLIVPFTGGRPPSLSSMSSTRTSRSSGYFSSANSVTQFDCQPDVNEFETGNRPTLKKVEEEEEEKSNDPHHQREKFNNNNNNNIAKEKAFHSPLGPMPYSAPKKRESLHKTSAKEMNERLEKVDHLSPIATMAMIANPQLTYVDRVILELLETERMYVRALEDILAGYIIPLTNAKGLSLTTTDRQLLFGNIKDIYVFNRKLLSDLENSDQDPVKIAEHFVEQDSSFSIYTKYCTNYPISVSVLTKFMKNPSLAQFFKNEQEKLHHNLPLGSYLLKPVQRILKYHLILQELVKNCDKKLKNYWIIEKALTTMTNIAKHINEMKRKHEDAVRIQEIQSLLTEWQGNDLTTYGDIIMEGELKLHGAKNERFVILFDKMILITKRHEDGFLSCKIHIMCSDLILLESVKENPLSFIISPFDTPTSHSHHHNRTTKQYVLTARHYEEKKMWTQNIKKQILKNHHTAIPLRAQESIMNMESVGLDDAAAEDNNRVTLHKLTSGLSTSQIVNGKPRRRSDSSSRKGLILRPWRKHEHEFSDEISSDSIPNTPTNALNKGKFSYPKFNPSTSPKVKTCEKSPLASIRSEVKNDSKSQAENNKKVQKKSEKYKEAVIYRRHKRRTSQPITDNEKRLSVRVPTDDENAQGDERKKSDLSMEDFDTMEDFLSMSIGNRRESISWDKQIVEPFFEKLKEEKEKKESQIRSAEPNSSILIPMPRRQRFTATLSDSSSDENDNQNNLKVNTKPQQVDSPSNSPAKFTDESHGIETRLNATINNSKLNNEPKQKQSFTLLNQTSHQQIQDQTSSATKQSKPVSDQKSPVKSSATSVPKLKRSLSTQSTNTDRRRYFEKLKKSRDRRHSQLCLGSDAKAIQAGKVREMIEHHREQMITPQVQLRRTSVPEQTINDRKPYNKRSESCERVLRSSSLSPPSRNHTYTEKPVILRNKRDYDRKSYCGRYTPETNNTQPALIKQKYRSADLETIHANKRFSTITTASLPLQFTSSSSCSSDSESEDPSNCTSPNTIRKFKRLFQSQMFLSRSYSQDLDSNTRRSHNLIIQTSPQCGNEQDENDGLHFPDPDQKFLFKEIGKIDIDDLQKDKMSEQVDSVWDDLESSEIKSQKPKPSIETMQLTETCLSDCIEHKIESNSFNRQQVISSDSKSTTALHTAAKPFTSSTKTYQRVDTPKQKADDLLPSSTHPVSTSRRRQGRPRERENSSNVTSSRNSYVMKLTQQFNQMAEENHSPSRKNLNRSHSARSNLHTNDLRVSASYSSKETSSVDTTHKPARNEVRRHESLMTTRKIERSLSPRQRPISTSFVKDKNFSSGYKRESTVAETRTSSAKESTATYSWPQSHNNFVDVKAEMPLDTSNTLQSCSTSYNESFSPETQSSISRSDLVARFCKV